MSCRIRRIRRAFASAMVGLVSLAACSVGAAPGELDADLLSRLDVGAPESIDWRRTIGPLEVAGSGTRADADELQLLEEALALLPESLIETSGTETIYRVPDGADVEPKTLAFAKGHDIYVIDKSFAGGPGVLDVVAMLAHELAHAGQFARLNNADVEAVLDDPVPDPIASSAFVSDFAEAVGWDLVERSGDAVWVLRTPGATTDYGATSPEEDMAESVAAVVTGRTDQVSRDRVRWVEEWLGSSAGQLARGMPWLPSGSERVTIGTPLYDEAAAGRHGSSLVPTYYALPATLPEGSSLARTIAAELGKRGLAGTLAVISDDRVERHGGFFVGGASSYWVELWDFRNAPRLADPPDHPILTYVWVG